VFGANFLNSWKLFYPELHSCYKINGFAARRLRIKPVRKKRRAKLAALLHPFFYFLEAAARNAEVQLTDVGVSSQDGELIGEHPTAVARPHQLGNYGTSGIYSTTTIFC